MTKPLCSTRGWFSGRAFPALLLPSLLACLLAGCKSLPDVQPFSDATLQLRSAVASSGAAVVSELQQVQIPGAATNAVTLEENWAKRNEVFNSLADYAVSLQSIVDAGKTGAEAASALADSVQRLAVAANVIQPGASAGTTLAVDTAKFVYEHIARARAARSLESALAEIQPSVQRIAEIMALDIENLDALLRVACKSQKNALEEQFQRETGYRDQLIRSRERLYASLQQKLSDGQSPSGLAEASELARVDELLAAAEQACEPLNTQLADINARERLGRQLLAEIHSGLFDWATVHARMLNAIRTRRVPSAAQLTAAAERIQSLVERYEKL